MSKKKKHSHQNETQQKTEAKPQSDFRVQDYSFSFEFQLKKVIGLLALLITFVPLVSYAGFLFPYSSPKLFLVYVLSGAIFGLYVVLCFLNKHYLPNLYFKKENGEKSRNWILLSLATYVLVLILTTFFSVDSAKSFFGSVGLMAGLLTTLHFFLMFIVLSLTFRGREFWILFMRVNMLVGIFVAGYALMEKMNGIAAPMATFGNPVELAGYLIFITFQALTLFYWDNKNSWKNLHWLAGSISVATIFLTTTIRGAHLGVVAGVGAIILLFGLAHKQEKVRKVFRWLTLIGLVATIAVSAYVIKSGKIYYSSDRSYTIKTRFVAWEAGLRGFGDKFLTGYGLENYAVPFEKYFQPTYYNQGSGSATEFGVSSPHNKIIEVAVFSGIFGLLSYLAIFATIFYLIYTHYLETRRKVFLGLAGLFAAYLVHLFFIFDSAVTLTMFFPSLAFLIFVVYKDEINLVKKEKEVAAGFGSVALVSSVVLIVFGYATFYFVIAPAKVASFANQAVNLVKAGKYAESLVYLEKMHQANEYFVEQEAILEIGRLTQIAFFSKTEFSEADKKYFEKIVELAAYNVQKNPSDWHYYVELASLQDRAGRYDQHYFEKNIELLEKAIAGGTKRVEAYMILADAYGATGNRAKAEELGQAGIALDPTYGYSYYLLGNIYYYRLENVAKANENFETAFKLGYKNLNSLKAYADVNVKTNNFPKAIFAFEELIKLNPKDAQQYANLVMLYYSNKEYAKARAMAEETKKRFPNTQAQIDAFLKIIPTK